MNVKLKLESLKLKWISKYNAGEGRWRSFFNYWINRASGTYNLDWYVFNNPPVATQTTMFYKEILDAFYEAEGRINVSVNCFLEAQNLPLWKNSVITCNKHKNIDSVILKANGWTKLRHVCRNSTLKSVREIGEACKLKPMNAGRIRAGIRKAVYPSFITETRQGPANHVSNMLEIKNYQQHDDFIPLAKETCKTIYRNLLSKNNTKPIAETRWETFFNLNCAFDWDCIWKNGWNKFLDHDDRDVWYKLKHRILPTKDKLLKMKITKDDTCPLCNVERETIEHLFIYCQKHLDAWIFVENLLRKYKANSSYYLNDVNRILGQNMDDIALCITGKLHKVIWSVRCNIVSDPNESIINPDILGKYKKILKQFIMTEKTRLSEHEFCKFFTRNQALCTLDHGKISFLY